MKRKHLNQVRARRTVRTRARVFGTRERPRLAVFRSNHYAYAQLIDDAKSQTLVQASSREFDQGEKGKSKTERARLVGELVAKRAREKGISQAIFDRRRYRYHGRIKALAEGARKGGLKV